MYKYKLFLVVLFLTYMTGCSTIAPKQSVSQAVSPSQVIPTVTSQVESPSPYGNLQLTFVRYKEDFTEFYAMDIDCTQDKKPCFGKPNLLFKTLPDSKKTSDQPSGLIDGYSWSPGGDKIVLSAGKDIFLGGIDTQAWENISDTNNIEEYNPAWSPNGNYIYYLSCSDDQGMGFCKLARYNIFNDTTEILLNKIDKSIVSYAVSPDDQHVIFSVSDGFDQLFESNLDGSYIQKVTTTDFEETSPAICDDGKSVAYVRTNRPILASGSKRESDIIIQNMKWEEEKNLTQKFDDEASSPVFSPNGKWIAFEASDRYRNYNVYVIPVDNGDVIPVTNSTDNSIYPAWRSLEENK